jgi:hypothetical protein
MTSIVRGAVAQAEKNAAHATAAGNDQVIDRHLTLCGASILLAALEFTHWADAYPASIRS